MEGFGAKDGSMVTRMRLTVSVIGVYSLSLLALPAVGGEASIVQKAAPAAELVDARRFRDEIEDYVRELNRQMRTTLSEELRRELKPNVVMAENELRASG